MNLRVLILGATSAIAHQTARCFAGQHARLFLVGRDPAKLEILAEDLKVRGAEFVQTSALDLRNYSKHHAVISQALEDLGGLDAALVAHGALPDQLACEHDMGALRDSVDVNCLSTISLLAELANVFEGQRAGVLGVIGSVAGDRGRRSNYIYGSSKAAVATFVAGLRARLAPAGVRVVLIKPGFVKTPMTMHLKQNFLYTSAERAGRDVYKSILSPRAVVYVPGFWRWIMVAIRIIPEPIFAKLNL